MNLVNPIRYIFYANLNVEALKKALSDKRHRSDKTCYLLLVT